MRASSNRRSGFATATVSNLFLRKWWLSGVAAALMLSAAGEASTLRVPSQYPTIQAAVNAADNDDTVLVADGVYTGRNNINVTLGGKRITVRSENGAAATIIDVGRDGAAFVVSDNEPPETVIEGFTIRGGSQSGIRIDGAALTVRECIIEDNWNGALGGGGILVENGQLILIDSVVDDNKGTQGGGILLWEQSEASIYRSTLSNNMTDIVGGGALMADLGSTLFMESSVVTRNRAVGFVGSSAGLRFARKSAGTIVNTLFYRNNAQNNGAAISFTNNSSGQVINCTIANNTASGHGAGVLLTAGVGQVRIANTIVWGNTPDQISQGGGMLDVSYSLVEAGWPGTGNVTGHPQFINPMAGDFMPASNIVVDAGDNTALPAHVTTDILGEPRFVDIPSVPGSGVPGGSGGSAIVDIGAYERQEDTTCYADCDGNEVLDVNDFLCFVDEFAIALTLPPSQQVTSYANCDGSTTEPILSIDDFLCFIDEFAVGCP